MKNAPKKKERSPHLDILVSQEERQLLDDAAKAAHMRSTAAWVRKTALDAAAKQGE